MLRKAVKAPNFPNPAVSITHLCIANSKLAVYYCKFEV